MEESLLQVKEQEPISSTEWQSIALQVLRGLPPQVHRGQVLSTVHNSSKAPVSLLKSTDDSFPNEGRKAITCNSLGSSRSPVLESAETQNISLHLPAKDSICPAKELEC
jgi:hypothetical protein